MTTGTELYEQLLMGARDLGLALGIPVAYTGISFTPPATGEWLELAVFPNDRDFGLNEKYKFKRGLAQINICGRKDRTGIIKLSEYADIISATLQLGDVLIDDTRVTSNVSVMESFIRDDTDLILPVFFEYAE